VISECFAHMEVPNIRYAAALGNGYMVWMVLSMLEGKAVNSSSGVGNQILAGTQKCA